MSARGERPVTPPAGLWIGTNRGGLHPLRHGDGWSTGTPYPDAINVSFGVHSPRHDLHYLVDERDDARSACIAPPPTDGDRSPAWRSMGTRPVISR